MSHDPLLPTFDTIRADALEEGDHYRTRRNGDVLRLRKVVTFPDGRRVLHGTGTGGVSITSTATVRDDDLLFRS